MTAPTEEQMNMLERAIAEGEARLAEGRTTGNIRTSQSGATLIAQANGYAAGLNGTVPKGWELFKPTLDKTPLKAGAQLICVVTKTIGLTLGRAYTVLEDEYQKDGWRIIRVITDDGEPTKVPPQWFTQNGVCCGCPDCYDRGIIRGGVDRGEFIAKCKTCT